MLKKAVQHGHDCCPGKENKNLYESFWNKLFEKKFSGNLKGKILKVSFSRYLYGFGFT